ncbi:MAG: carbohydrate ABC transporter permease [Treponema sp.]|nr:carbohydrate ABC transporter permease [Treponema sp.]
MTTNKAAARLAKRERDAKRSFHPRVFTEFAVNIILCALIVCVSFAILYPLLTLMPMAFTDLRKLGDPNSVWIPPAFSVNSFEFVFRYVMRNEATNRGDLMILAYSILYALSIALIQLFMSAMAGYALARTKFWGRNIVFFLVIFVFLIPRQSFLITQYLNFKRFDVFGIITLLRGSTVDLINKPITLYLLAIFGFSVNQSLFIFILRQFFNGMPKELEEAALIDGMGFYKTYFRIMLPNAAPALLTVGVLAFVWAYGDIYYTGYFNPGGPYFGKIIDMTFKDANNWYINVAARNWFGTSQTNDLAFEALKQSSILTFLAPLLIIYFLVQKRIVENLDSIGIKG